MDFISPSRLGWLAREPQGSPICSSPVLGLQALTTMPGSFVQVLEIELRLSYFPGNLLNPYTNKKELHYLPSKD